MCIEAFMRIYEEKDIEQKFQKAINAISDKSIDAKSLSILFGSLSLALNSRVTQLKTGIAKSSDRKNEISKLIKVQSNLTSKMNSASVHEMAKEILAAHKEYATNH